MNSWQRKLLAFVAVDERLTDESLIKKGAATAILFPSFRFLEWLLVAATATIFSLFKYYGFTEYAIWIILWSLNLILSGSVILFNDYIKVDITLMQTARKFINALIERKKIVGHLLELAIVLRNQEEKVIGYIVAIPQTNVYKDLKEYDPAMEDDPARFYVETIQTLPGQRQTFGVMRLLYGMCEEGERRGFNKFSMHARKLNGLSDMILKVSVTARRLRTIENWYGYGEPFDYIELTYVGKRR